MLSVGLGLLSSSDTQSTRQAEPHHGSRDSTTQLSREQFRSGRLHCLAAASLATGPSSEHSFVLADDLGYGDLSCYGRPDYRTPHLDRLARQGLRFTSNYTAAAVCSPTRVALMTGRYPARLPIGLLEPLVYGDDSVGLPPEHPTPASLLKAAGYETALIGKWHLGFLPEHGPIRHGFDEFYGILGPAVDYFSHTTPAGKLDMQEGNVTVDQAGLHDRPAHRPRSPEYRPPASRGSVLPGAPLHRSPLAVGGTGRHRGEPELPGLSPIR